MKVGTFLAPITAATPGEAERVYSSLLSNAGAGLIHSHPRDFPLYEIGSYDEVSGLVSPLVADDGRIQPPRMLLSAEQLGIGGDK